MTGVLNRPSNHEALVADDESVYRRSHAATSNRDVAYVVVAWHLAASRRTHPSATALQSCCSHRRFCELVHQKPGIQMSLSDARVAARTISGVISFMMNGGLLALVSGVFVRSIAPSVKSAPEKANATVWFCFP